MSQHVTLAEIGEAAARIGGRVERTAMVTSTALSDKFRAPVHLKLESRQATGSFKLRGATNAVALLTPAEKARGVVTASTGNHGRALSYAAGQEGIRAVICMSSLVPANKVEEIERLGAEVRIVGASQDEAQVEADRIAAEQGLAVVQPFDDRNIVAGQGTLGPEMIDEVPEVATVLVPLSGGGLAAGIAAAVKGRNPGVRVVGISMRRGAAMKASLDAGHAVDVRELPTLADSLGGGIGLANRITFAMCRDLLDEVILVSEVEIAEGVRHLYHTEREIAEGAGAVGVAAFLAGKVHSPGPVVALVSGRNIDMTLHRQIVQGATTRFEQLEREDGHGRAA